MSGVSGLWETIDKLEAEITRLKAELEKRCVREKHPSCPYGTCQYHCES